MVTVTIDRGFNGPDRSGNGGYVAGLVAAPLGVGPTTTTLRVPPPLGVPLDLSVTGSGAVLSEGDRVIAQSQPAEPFSLEPVAFVDPEQASRSAEQYAGFDRHPFARCFTCGTDRHEGDGLRVFSGPVPGRPDTVAAPWTPHPAFGEHPDVPVVWASIDCPGSWAAHASENPMVLGRMTGQVLAPVTAGTEYVAVGALRAVEGRKRLTATALYGSDGTLVARSEQTWITVDASAFG